MITLTLFFFLSTFVLMATAYLLPGFEIDHIGSAFVAVIFIGILNFLIRPILILLRVPVNPLSVGLVSFVLNALMLNASAGVIDGFDLRSWDVAVLGAIMLAIIQATLDVVITDKRKLLR